MADFKEFSDISYEEERKPLFNPFPGLRPFTIKESHLFFGREGQSEEVLYKLSENKFVAVLGASGSGKSSLMYCGLLPILYGGFITNAGSRWRIVTTRPGTNPIDNLATALANTERKEGEDEEDYNFLININKTVLRSSSLGLVEAVRQLKTPKYENVLIMVDQFEELFRFKRMHSENSVNETEAFVKLLVEARKQSIIPIYVILTMRSDFIGDCSNFQDLTSLINESHFLIPQMKRNDFKDAIIGPVAVGGGDIDPHLVQQLLNEVGDNPDQLPILQHAMMRTWDFWIKNTKGSRPIGFGDYEAIGKMERALSDHANEAFDELNLEAKRICQIMFKSLTERGADNRGIRRPTIVTEIADIGRSDIKDVFDVVNRFRKGGRSFLTPSIDVDLTEKAIVDISHESLMRIWNKLRLWVDEEAAAVQMYSRLSEAAGLFQEGKTGLWRPPDLQLALNWRDKQQPTLTWAKRYNPAFERAMVYLSSSEREYLIEEENKIRLQKRQLRRSKIFFLLLGSASIISLGFMLYSVVLAQEAEKQRISAEKQKIEAERQQNLAQEASSLAEEQRVIAETKSAEAIKQKNEADHQKQLAENSALEAKRQEERATLKSEEAIEQRKLAESSALEANRQREEAEKARNEAFTRRMLSISQSMAVKSQTFDQDVNVKSLLAFQSYKFNELHAGSSFHPDIYSGVYIALKAEKGEKYNVLNGHQGKIGEVVFSPSGTNMYSTGSDGSVIQWTFGNDSVVKKVLFQSSIANQVLKINALGDALASVNDLNRLTIYNLSDTIPISRDLGFIDSPVQFLKFVSNKPELLISASGTNLFRYDYFNDTMFVHRTFNSNIEKIVEGNNNQFAVVQDRLDVLYYSDKDEMEISFKDILMDRITSLKFANRSDILAVGDVQGNVVLWDLVENKEILKLGGHKARISGIAFSPDDEILATCSYDGSLYIRERANFNNQPIVISDFENWNTTLEFSPDGKMIVVGTIKDELRIIPARIDFVIGELCEKIKRNFTLEEWKTYVASDIPYEKTCENLE